MKKTLLKIIIICLYILCTKQDCNYITMSPSTERCKEVHKQDKTKNCCYVKIKKKDVDLEYCAEVAQGNEKEYKRLFIEKNKLDSMTVKCFSNMNKVNKILFLFMIFVLL